jgi:hypothetical protein
MDIKMTKKSLPHYLEVFEKRINAQKEKIKAELSKEKNNRDKKALKKLLHDIKGLRKAVAAAKEDHATKCPHCGHKL